MNEIKRETKPLEVVDKVSRVDALKYTKLIYPTMILSSNSRWFLAWQAILLVTIIFDVFINSFEVAFLKRDIEIDAVRNLDTIVLWVYFFDFVIRCNTTFVNTRSEEVCNRKDIFEEYRSSFYFYTDIIAMAPIESVLLSTRLANSEILRRFFPVHRLAKVFRMSSAYRNIEKRSVYKLSFMVLRVIFQLSFQLHIISCLWYAVVLYSYDQDKESPYLWLPPQLRMTDIGFEKGREFYYESKDVFYSYTQTFYSVLAQMSGNDINVTDELQVVLSIIIGLLGSVNLGIIFGNVMLVYQKLSSTSNEYLEKLNQFRLDAEEKETTGDSRIAGLNFLEFCYNIKKFDEKKDDFTMLSRNLQMQVDFVIFKRVVRSFPLFMHLSDEKVLRIIQMLKYAVFTPNSYIYNKGDPAGEIYFLMSGSVKVYLKDSEYISVGDGKYFGEGCFYNNAKRNAKAVSKEYSIVFMYSKRDHLQLMKEDSEYREGIKKGKEEVKKLRMEEILTLIREKESLSGFTTFEIMQLVTQYSELVYLEEEQLVLSPTYSSNCRFLILSGRVAVYEATPENEEAISKHYQKKRLLKDELNTRSEVHSLDKMILKKFEQKIEDDLLADVEVKVKLTAGSWFGCTRDEPNDIYVITKTFSEMLMINNSKLHKLQRENRYLFRKFLRIFQQGVGESHNMWKAFDPNTAAEDFGFMNIPALLQGQEGADDRSVQIGTKVSTDTSLNVLENIKMLVLKLGQSAPTAEVVETGIALQRMTQKIQLPEEDEDEGVNILGSAEIED